MTTHRVAGLLIATLALAVVVLAQGSPAGGQAAKGLIDPNTAAWAAWRPRFAEYDVVIQTCNEGAMNGLLTGVKAKPDWPDAVKMAFANFVRNGGGVYIFHAAENAFVGWKEYEDMVGLSWRAASYGSSIRVGENGEMVRIAPGEGGDTSHGPRADRLITRIGDDPIHAEMPKAWLTPDSEVYVYARGPAERVKVLAYAEDTVPGLGLLWPVEWTTTYGKGRVYVSVYGHVWPGDVQPAAMRCAAVQTIIPRVLQWLAGRQVIQPRCANASRAAGKTCGR